MQEKTSESINISAPPAYILPPPTYSRQSRQTDQNGSNSKANKKKPSRVQDIEAPRGNPVWTLIDDAPPSTSSSMTVVRIPPQGISHSQPETEEEFGRLQRQDSDPVIVGGLPSAGDPRQSMSAAQLERAKSQLNPLAQLFHYHITQKCPTFGARHAFITGTSVVISGLSLFLYILPTASYAANNSELLGPVITTVVLESGVTISNFNVAALATSETLTAFFGKKLSPEILSLINDEKRSKFISVIRLGGFTIGSFFAATPFGVSVQGNLYEKAIVELTVAFINFYGLNTIILKHYRHLQKKLTRDEKKRAIFTLKDSLTSAIEDLVKEQLNSDVMDRYFTSRTEYNADDLLQLLAKYLEIHFKDRPRVPQKLTWGQFFARRVAPALVSAIVPIIGMIPYNINIYDLWDYYFADDTLSIPFTVIFAAIFQYIAIGAATSLAIETLDFLLGKSEKSVSMKLNPARTMAANFVLLLFAVFSYGTSAYFIDSSKHFNGEGAFAAFKNFFLAFAILSPDLFNAFGGINFARNIGELCTEFWGVPHNKDKAHFAMEMREFINNFNYVMSDKKFIDSIERMDFKTRQALFPLPPHETVETLIEKAKGEYHEEESNSVIMEDFTVINAPTIQVNSGNEGMEADGEPASQSQATSHWYGRFFQGLPSLPANLNPLRRFSGQGYSTVSQDDDDEDDAADNSVQSAPKSKGRCAVM